MECELHKTYTEHIHHTYKTSRDIDTQVYTGTLTPKGKVKTMETSVHFCANENSGLMIYGHRRKNRKVWRTKLQEGD